MPCKVLALATGQVPTLMICLNLMPLCAVAHGPFVQGGNTLVWYSIAGMLSASFGASMLPVAKFAWEKLEFILAPPQDREKQQQVSSASQVVC